MQTQTDRDLNIVHRNGLNNSDDSKEGIQKFLDRNPETCFVAIQDDIDGVILLGHDGRRGVYSSHCSQT